MEGPGLFCPDGLSGECVAGAPAFGELADEKQTAAALVEVTGSARVR